MLKFFRDQKDSWFVKAILILTALSFMSLFGIQGISEMRQKNKAVIELKGKKLTTQEFLNDYNQKIAMIRRLSGDFSDKDALNTSIMIGTINEMASRAVMEVASDNLNLVIPEDSVRKAVQEMPMFIGYDGEFSMTMFKDYLNNTGKTENQFIADKFLEMRAAQLLNAVKSGVVIPTDIAKTVYRLQGEKRDIDVFRINPADIKITKKPTAEELQAVYEEMSEDLIAPEYRKITAMKLDSEDMAKKITISEDELLEAYNENKAAYTVEEVRNVDQMLFISENEAKAASTALKQGVSFEKVAEDIANQTDDQTHLGDLTPSTATGEWGDAVFTAKQGEIVGPVQTSFGWQILRVNSIKPKIEKSFKQVRAEIEQKIKAAAAFDAMLEKSTALDDRLGAGESLETVAKSEGLELITYAPADATGVDENGKKIALPKSLLSVAFISDEKQDSPMIEEDNAFYVVRVDEIIEPALKSLEKSKPEVLANWTAQQQKKEAKKIVADIEERLKKGEAPQNIAKATNVKYERLIEANRTEASIPSGTVYAVFSQPNNAVVTTPAEGKYVVARSVKITPADPENDVLGVIETRRLMTEKAAEDRADTVLGAFGQDYKLTVKEAAVANAFSMITRSAQTNEE